MEAFDQPGSGHFGPMSYGTISEQGQQRPVWRRMMILAAAAAIVLSAVVVYAICVHVEEAASSAQRPAPLHAPEQPAAIPPTSRGVHAASSSAPGPPPPATVAKAHTSPPQHAGRQARPQLRVKDDYLNSDDLAYFPDDVIAALNPSVDPCVDFYEYACGGWRANASIPSYQPAWAKQWDGVTKYVERLTIGLLQKDAGPAGRFFRSCMGMHTIQKLGASPLQPWLAEVDKVVDHRTLSTSLIQMAISDINVFWNWYVDSDSEDSSIYSFFLEQGGISMPDRDYYLKDSAAMQQHRARYREMGTQLLKLAGFPAEVAAREMGNNMEVETAIARAMTPRDQDRDEHGSRYSVAQLSQLSPDVDWQGWFGGLGLHGLGVAKGRGGAGYLVVKNAGYLGQVSKILREIGVDKIRSYLRFQVVYSYAPFLDLRFEHVLLSWDRNLYGITVLPPREKKCFFSTTGAMDMEVSKLFVDAYFPEASRQAALGMLLQIRQVFNTSLQHKDWMDPATRAKAVSKLGAMFMEVGHPGVWPASTFENFTAYGGIHPGTYFDNCVATNSWDVWRTIAKMGKPVDRKNWGESSATDVNSYYNRKVNGIFIPAGILQRPFYARDQPAARNYGSIGAICGHEMTHGFDDVGREYDASGNRNGWWTPEVVANFKTRAKCISDLFSSFRVHGQPVNGKLTLGESIADSGGVKFAWEAFVANHKPDPSAKRLFLVAMGQTWCEKDRQKAAAAALLTDEHPPNKFRVIGTLSQFAPFAEAYQCAPGSPMNPPTRCHLW